MRKTKYITVGLGGVGDGSINNPFRVSYDPQTGKGITLDAIFGLWGNVDYVLDSGTYYSRNVELATGATIRGEGSDRTIIRQIDQEGILIGQHPTVGVINRTSFSGFCLELSPAGLYSSGLHVYGDGIRVRDVGVRHAGGNYEKGAESFPILVSSRQYNSNAYRPEAIKPNIVEECWVRDFIPDGEWLLDNMSATYATAILVDCVPGCRGRIDNCNVVGSSRSFLHAAFAGSNVQVFGNYAYGARAMFYGDTYDLQDIVVEQNHAVQIWCGVLLVMDKKYVSRRVIVRDNVFELSRGRGYGCYGVMANGIDTLRVVSNTLTMDTDYEKVRVPYGIVALSKSNCRNVMVLNNRFILPDMQVNTERQGLDYLQKNCINPTGGDNNVMYGTRNERLYWDVLQG